MLSRSNDRLTKRRLAVSEICITRPPAQPCLRNPNQTLWTAPRLGMWLNSLRPQSRRLRGEFAMTYCKSLISVSYFVYFQSRHWGKRLLRLRTSQAL